MRRLALLAAAGLLAGGCGGQAGPTVRTTVLPWGALRVEGSGWRCGGDVAISLPRPWGYRLPTSVDRDGQFAVEIPEVQREPPQARPLVVAQPGCGARRTTIPGWHTSDLDQRLIDVALAGTVEVAPFARRVGVAPCDNFGVRLYCRTLVRRLWYGGLEVSLVSGYHVDDGHGGYFRRCAFVSKDCGGPFVGSYVLRFPWEPLPVQVAASGARRS